VTNRSLFLDFNVLTVILYTMLYIFGQLSKSCIYPTKDTSLRMASLLCRQICALHVDTRSYEVTDLS